MTTPSPLDDAAYWGLSHAETARWLARISRYHACQSRRYGDEAIRLFRLSRRLNIVVFVLVGLALAIQLASLIAREASQP